MARKILGRLLRVRKLKDFQKLITTVSVSTVTVEQMEARWRELGEVTVYRDTLGLE